MNNPLPDLGVELLKKYNKGTFFYFQNFIIGQITFNYQEYISVTAKVFLNIPTLATFDYSIMEFEKFIHNLPNTPTLIDLKNNYEKYYIDSSDKIIFVEVQDHIQIDTNSYIAGYLWDETVDGNGLAFAPFQSFELAKNYSPSFVQKGERPLNVIAFDFLQCASFDNINIPEMEPYLNAMLSMTDIEENYGYDRGSVIVIYFLESIKKWKTKNVKPLRNELRMKLKKYQKNQDKIV